MTWSGTTRAPLRDQMVYPPIEPAARCTTWVGVGGSPESVVRAARYGLPLMLAIIGGSPRRFAPYVDLYHRALEQFGHAALPIGVHSPGSRRRDRRAGARGAVAALQAALMTRIGAERGWPPMTRGAVRARGRARRRAVRRLAGDGGAARSPRPMQALGLTRFDLKYSNGTLPHDALMTSIELYGTKVVPLVRELLDAAGYRRPERASRIESGTG